MRTEVLTTRPAMLEVVRIEGHYWFDDEDDAGQYVLAHSSAGEPLLVWNCADGHKHLVQVKAYQESLFDESESVDALERFGAFRMTREGPDDIEMPREP